jgi:hypothetical protein
MSEHDYYDQRAQDQRELAEGHTALADSSAERRLSQINDPGARPKPGGVVTIQLERRSVQLDTIAEFIEGLTPESGTVPVALTVEQARKLWGYAQQLGIIAGELARAGK